MIKTQCFKTTRRRKWLKPRSPTGGSGSQGKKINVQFKAILKSGYLSKERPITSSVLNAHLSFDFGRESNHRKPRLSEGYSLPRKGVIFTGLCMNLIYLRTRIRRNIAKEGTLFSKEQLRETFDTLILDLHNQKEGHFRLRKKLKLSVAYIYSARKEKPYVLKTNLLALH